MSDKQLSNGVPLVNLGRAYGDESSDDGRTLGEKFNKTAALVLTINDRAMPNADTPFTFEGDLEVLGQVTANQMTLRTLTVEKTATVSGDATFDQSVAINSRLTVGGSAQLKGDVEVEGELSVDSLRTSNQLAVNRLDANNEDGFIDLQGNKIVNAFQTPTRAFELTNKQYVDQRLQGMRFFASCRVVDFQDPLSNEQVSEEKDTDGNFTGRLSGTAGLTIDGVDLELSDRVLITSFRNNLAYRNGVYEVIDPGSNTAGWVLERAEDFQLAETMNQSEMVYIREGDKGSNAVYQFIRETPIEPNEVYSRPLYFSPLQFNVSVFSGGEAEIQNRLDSLEVDLNDEVSRLEDAITRAQQTVLPTDIEAPVGTVIFSLSDQLSLRNGTYLKLDGSEYSQADYPDLYAVVGNQYDRAETSAGKFRLPDMQGRSPVASSDGKPLGQTGGVDNYQLRPSQLPSSRPSIYSQGHNHGMPVWREDNQYGTEAIDDIDGTAPLVTHRWQQLVSSNSLFKKATISSETGRDEFNASQLGRGQAINNMPPYFAATAYVKAKPALVANQLPQISWFSFDRDTVNTNRASSSRSTSVYVELNLQGFSTGFLDGVKVEIINEATNTAVFKTVGVDASYSNRKEIQLQDLPVGDNSLALRLSEPTVPNDIQSTGLTYRRFPPESPTPNLQSQVDRTCRFEILSAFATPQQVSIGDTINYRTQAMGVYHIQSTLYHFPADSEEATVIPGTVTGDIRDVSCRQLLTAGSWVVPRTARAGDLIAVEFKYWSPVTPSQDAYRVETIYVDVV